MKACRLRVGDKVVVSGGVEGKVVEIFPEKETVKVKLVAYGRVVEMMFPLRIVGRVVAR